jgi:hypothetical protein
MLNSNYQSLSGSKFDNFKLFLSESKGLILG